MTGNEVRARPSSMTASTLINIRFRTEQHYAGPISGPSYATPGSAGFDLIAPQDLLLESGDVGLIPTGLFVELPPGLELQIRSRSGLALKSEVIVLNSPGTIDADYRGEVKVILKNVGRYSHFIRRGDAVAQGVLAHAPQAVFERVESLSETSRGAGGFGSTGR